MTQALAPVLMTPPEATPVSLDEAKAHLRVDGDGEDTLITSLIEAATAHMDGWSGILGRALVTQGWRQDLPGFCDPLTLPLAPVTQVDAIRYFDHAGTQRTLEPGHYRLQSGHARPRVIRSPGRTWPATAGTQSPGTQSPTRSDGDMAPAVSVTFVAGFGRAGDVPAPIRQAILLMVGHLYANRGDGNAAMPAAVKHLIAPYRRTFV